MRRIGVIGLLLMVLAACQLQPANSGISADDQVSTLVAATLTAAPTGKYLPLPTNPALPTDQPALTTPDPASTAQLTTDTPQPTPTATFTPSPTPTQTATPTPSLVPGDPATTLGSPTFDDRFNGTTNFYQWDNSSASYQIEQDQMVLIAKKANSYETWSLSWKEIEDFYLEATGKFGPDCTGKDRFGMIFRAPDTSQGYIIGLSCDGSYRLSKYESDEDEYTVLKSWTSTSISNPGPDATNRLGVRVQGTLIAGYVNGNKVFEINNDTFGGEGRMGVMVAASNTPGFTTYLTRVAYWELP
jgi:hypothetical protein